MQVKISGQHVEVTDAIRSYIKEKQARLERHFDKITSIHVIISVDKLEHKAEAILHIAGGEIHAQATEQDIYAAIDSLTDKVDRQLIKYKEKQQNKH